MERGERQASLAGPGGLEHRLQGVVTGDDATHRPQRQHQLGAEARPPAPLGAAPVQHIGKLLVFWREPRPKEKAEREDRMPGPKVVKVLKFSKSGNHRPQVKKVKVLGNMRLAAGGELKRARKRATSVKKLQQG